MSKDQTLTIAGCAAAATALTYYMTRSDPVIDPLYDFEKQSIEIDPVDRVRVCSYAVGKPLMEYRFDDVKTIYDVIPKGLRLSNNGLCLGEREGPSKGPYTWQTYSEVIEKINAIASGIVNKGIESDNKNRIGIYSANRSEWIISEHACYSMSLVVVSLYETYGKDSIKYILNHADIQALFVDNFKRLSCILDVIDELNSLKLIVHFDNFTEDEKEKIKYFSNKIEIISFKELLRLGQGNPRTKRPPKPSDIATICYTSGTTGIPKGALISHLNIISSEAAIYERLNKPHLSYPRDKDVVVFCFLPLAHMLERQSSILTFLAGGQLGFISGDLTSITDDLKELKPTDIPMVPRLLNRLYNSVMNQVSGSLIKRQLLARGISSKIADIRKGIYKRDTIYDKLIFNKIRASLGGNIIRTATGSAPISDEVMLFCRAALGCPIPEGYGQTEATCGITFSHPFDVTLGHTGPPLTCNMVKLVDVPEMGYYSKNNQGEICAKGPNVFQGYLKDPEKTAEVIDKDGWLHTGDIGTWLPNGTLKIIDRKKNLFKLSQGEYISPEKIENTYLRSPFIGQCFVDGNSLKDFIVAVVVPDEPYLLEYCKTANISGSFKELCQNQQIKKLIMDDLERLGKQAGLMSFEKVKNIYLHPELMTLDNGLATPTMKIKRNEVRKYFKDVIARLYEQTKIPSKI